MFGVGIFEASHPVCIKRNRILKRHSVSGIPVQFLYPAGKSGSGRKLSEVLLQELGSNYPFWKPETPTTKLIFA